MIDWLTETLGSLRETLQACAIKNLERFDQFIHHFKLGKTLVMVDHFDRLKQ